MLFIFSPYIGLAEWGIFLISEAFLISIYLFRLEKLRSVLICLTVIMLYAAWGAFSTSQARDDQVLNAFDFGECTYLLFASSWIIFRIIKEDRFEQDLVAFFTFFGVVTYAALQIIATIIMAFDFRENEDFSFFAVIITFTFWLLAVPWIRRLRYKLT